MKSMSYWIKKLALQNHPEGGYYRETYRNKNQITVPGLIEKPHNIGTDIFYLLANKNIGHFSAWHRLNNLDEIWHFHYGVNLTIYIIDMSGHLHTKKLGTEDDAELQILIPANYWFAAAVEHAANDAYSLVSCTVYPAFCFEDFELAKSKELIAIYPQHKDIIETMTRQ